MSSPDPSEMLSGVSKTRALLPRHHYQRMVPRAPIMDTRQKMAGIEFEAVGRSSSGIGAL